MRPALGTDGVQTDRGEVALHCSRRLTDLPLGDVASVFQLFDKRALRVPLPTVANRLLGWTENAVASVGNTARAVPLRGAWFSNTTQHHEGQRVVNYA